jgi:hypothetical protein
MTNWEYQVQRIEYSVTKPDENIEDKLEIQGHQGWELVNLVQLVPLNNILCAIYKRPAE